MLLEPNIAESILNDMECDGFVRSAKSLYAGRPPLYPTTVPDGIHTRGLKLMPCYCCGWNPLLLAWDFCPQCGTPLRTVSIRFRQARSKWYPRTVEVAKCFDYSETRVNGSSVHTATINVSTDTWRTAWDLLRLTIKWKGTEFLRGGVVVAAGQLDRLWQAYRVIPFHGSWSLPDGHGRGVFVED